MYFVRAEDLYNHASRYQQQRVTRLCRRLRTNDDTLEDLHVVDFTTRDVAKALRDLRRATKLRLHGLVLARSEVTLESFLSIMTLMVERKPLVEDGEVDGDNDDDEEEDDEDDYDQEDDEEEQEDEEEDEDWEDLEEDNNEGEEEVDVDQDEDEDDGAQDDKVAEASRSRLVLQLSENEQVPALENQQLQSPTDGQVKIDTQQHTQQEVFTSPLKRMFLCLHDDDIPVEEIRCHLFDGIATDHPPGLCELTQLQLCCGLMSITSATAIGRALASERTALTHLNLENNGITDETVELIAHGLVANHSLRHITLSANEIGNTGAQHLGQALLQNSTLKSMDLRGNHIGNDGAMALANALEHQNRSLYSLVLDDNEVGDEGLSALCRAVADNPAFEYLSIDENHMTPAGELSLVDAVASMRYLQRLKFGPLQRTSSLVRLAASMERNTSIFQVGFDVDEETFTSEENLEELKSLTSHVYQSHLEYFGAKVHDEHPDLDPVPVEKICMLAKYKPYIDLICLLNKIGIRSLIFDRYDRVPLGLWSSVLDGMDRTFMFYVLRERPDLLLHASFHNEVIQKPPSLFQINPAATWQFRFGPASS